jgi:DNA-binding transcriptional MerR regulator
MVGAMTIGTLSRRSGIPVKALRTYEDMGLLYTVGRSPGNYRLFDEEALWCVAVVSGLRELGLTLDEIRGVAADYLQNTDEPIGPRLAAVLKAVRARTEQRIEELHERLRLIDGFEQAAAAELTGIADFRDMDPRSRKDRA